MFLFLFLGRNRKFYPKIQKKNAQYPKQFWNRITKLESSDFPISTLTAVSRPAPCWHKGNRKVDAEKTASETEFGVWRLW